MKKINTLTGCFQTRNISLQRNSMYFPVSSSFFKSNLNIKSQVRYYLTAQQSFWNRQAKEGVRFQTQFNLNMFNQYICQLKGKSSRILDFGCGYGRILHELEKNGYNNLYGVDFSKDMINRGKKGFPNLNLNYIDNGKINFEDNYFDACILFSVLTCIIRNKEQIALIKEIERLLKPGGILYISDFLLSNDLMSRKGYEKFKGKYGIYGIYEIEKGIWLRDHKPEWIKKLFQNFNVQEYKCENLNINDKNGSQSTLFQMIAKNNKEIVPTYRATSLIPSKR